MRILFCDDDPNFLQILSDMVKTELEKLKVEAELLPYYSGQQLLKQIEFMPVDVIFLDIDMPEMSGFDIAAIVEKLSLQPILIFVSNLDHLVYESFTYNPFWFLRKSHLEPLPLLINKLVEQVRLLKQTFSFEANGEKISLLLKDITYFESDNHYITVHTTSEKYRYKARISEITKELVSYHFVRTHVGFLVNCQYITLIRQTELILRSGSTVPVSRNRLKEVQERFLIYTRSVQT